MDWYDVDDILYEGSKDEMLRLACPECGGAISFAYYTGTSTFEVACTDCGYFSRDNGAPKPNCAVVFGDTATIDSKQGNANSENSTE